MIIFKYDNNQIPITITDASLGGVYLPPMASLAAKDGPAWKTALCEVYHAQVVYTK